MRQNTQKRAKPLRRRSKKRAARDRKVGPERYALVMAIGKCELTGSRDVSVLALHEIARSDRVNAYDKRFATLCLANSPINMGPSAHQIVAGWPVAKQLCLLYVNRPLDFQLASFNRLVNRQVTHKEVMQFVPEIETLLESRPHRRPAREVPQ